MPARTNAFQKLVHHVQVQLAPDCGVTESRMLVDRHSGEEREVDIVVQKEIAGQQLIISVECTAHDRPQTIEWVDRMIGKHQSLPTDVLVLVSASGFTDAAEKKAQLANARAESLGKALDADWTSIVGKLEEVFFARFEFTPTGCLLLLKDDGGALPHPVGPDMGLVSADGNRRGTVLDCAKAALHDHKTAVQIMDRITTDGKGEGQFEITFPDAVLVLASAGQHHQVLKLKFTFVGSRVTSKVPLKHGTWGSTPVAFGEGETPFGKTFLALEEVGPKVLRGTITYRDPGTKSNVTKDLRSYPRDES